MTICHSSRPSSQVLREPLATEPVPQVCNEVREKPFWGRHPQRFWYIERVTELSEMYEACPIVAEGLGLDGVHEHDTLPGNNVWGE